MRLAIALRPDPTLSGGDFDDESPATLQMNRTDWLVAGGIGLTLLLWWGVKLAEREGGVLFGPDPLDLQTATPYRLDINTASWAEWMQVPEIGETLARRIVTHRETHGRFETVDSLTAVRGIGPKTVVKIRPHLCADPIAGLALSPRERRDDDRR